ncbi:MAG: hypothetical protein QM479_14310 [Pseudomonadota bacterium]
MIILRVTNAQRILVFAGVLILLLASYFIGYFLSQRDFKAYLQDEPSLIELNKKLQNNYKQLDDEKHQLDIELQIERKTYDLLNQQLAGLNSKISRLKNELLFYQGIVNAADKGSGNFFQNITIQAANKQRNKLLQNANSLALKKIKSDPDYDLIKFSITIVNKANNKKSRIGRIKIDLFDTQGNQISEWKMIDKQARSINKLKVRFRYFQKLDAYLLINNKATISQIKFSFIDSRKGDLSISKEFDWTIDKDLNYVGQ